MTQSSSKLLLVVLAAPWFATLANGGQPVEASSIASEERIHLAQVVRPSASPRASDPAPPASRTVLGDLSRFRALAVEALTLAQSGDLRSARMRVKALEEDWELAATKMRPLSPDEWEKVESAIDRAERELWFWRARRTDSVEALQKLINTIDALK